MRRQRRRRTWVRTGWNRGRVMAASERDQLDRAVVSRGEPDINLQQSHPPALSHLASNGERGEQPRRSERGASLDSRQLPSRLDSSERTRVRTSEPSLHHIVIVGGGAAGLELATKLGHTLGRRRKAQVTLVERARTHVWKPHLHEVAAGTLDVGRDAVDYLAHAADHHFRYRIGEMVGLDRRRREVQVAASYDAEGEEITPARSVPYDTLIIAVGSTSNDFGTPGVQECAIALDTPEQAERFHQRLVNRFIRAHTQAGPVRPGQLHVAIIGAGATGTELAAELHRTTRQVVAYGLDRIDVEKDLKMTLVEAAERILPALPPRVSEGALRPTQPRGSSVVGHDTRRRNPGRHACRRGTRL